MASPPATKERRMACSSLVCIRFCWFFAAASLIDGNKEVDSEKVIKVGNVSKGIINPASSPYCFVATTVATPAIAKLCVTIIGSKKGRRFQSADFL